MALVLDAQVVASYFRETVLYEAPPYSGPARELIDALDPNNPAYVDEGGRIEQEWQGPVADEWFAAWYGDCLESGHIRLQKVEDCKDLVRVLSRECGFPQHRENRWYLCTARALVLQMDDAVVLVSEDLDFFEPKHKKSAARTRQRILKAQKGSVTRCLKKRERIVVRTIAGQLQES